MAERAVARVAPPVVAAILALLVWEGLVRALAVPLYLLPPPSVIAATAVDSGGVLFRGTCTTGLAAGAGFALSAVLGTLFAVVLSASRGLERALYPYTVVLQTVPIVAIAPLLVLWFGPGPRAVTVAAFIVSVFPVVANALTGLQSVDPALRDLFRLYGAGRWRTLATLSLPSALPHIFTGLRVAAGLAVIGAVVGEMVAGYAEDAPGLGILVMTAYKQLQTDLLFASVLGSTALGVALFGLVGLVGDRLLRRWHASAQSDPTWGAARRCIGRRETRHSGLP